MAKHSASKPTYSSQRMHLLMRRCHTFVNDLHWKSRRFLRHHLIGHSFSTAMLLFAHRLRAVAADQSARHSAARTYLPGKMGYSGQYSGGPVLSLGFLLELLAPVISCDRRWIQLGFAHFCCCFGFCYGLLRLSWAI